MKKIIAWLLAAMMVFGAVACTATTPESPVIETQTQATEAPKADNAPAAATAEPEVVYERGDDEEIYELALGEIKNFYAAAKAEQGDLNKRFNLMAQAEAQLLNAAVMIPTTTRGGTYQISRIAPRTIPYVQWGNDDDRLKGLVISDEFISKEERAELMDAWNKAVLGEADYDPAAILAAHGHSIKTDYTTTFSTAPATIDWLNTSMQSDTEITVNTVDGLVEYNNLGQMKPALAESWDISEDGLTYTFHIRPGVYWYTSEGQQYAEVTAEDFEAGLRHMLDAQEGLEWLIDGIVVGGTDYYAKGGSWDDVGYKATDKYTLTVTLEQPTSYFLTMLTYSCFLPICKSFYESRGGVFGVQEYAAAVADTNAYTFGKSEDVASQVYCGPFLLQKLQKDSEILVVKNEGYYKPEEVKINSIKWVADAGENPDALYNDCVSGVYSAIALREANGTLAKAKEDGNFDKYSYVTDTESTTYFGGLNLNRGTYALESGLVASTASEQQKIDTHTALMNVNFRRALLFAFDKGTYNAVSTGEDLKLTSLRNMYTHPQFVQLDADYTDENGHTFPAGTMYGAMVQYYLEQLGSPIIVDDMVDGWFHPEEAKAALEAAKAELGDSVSWPINIDVVYYSANDVITSQANATKKVIEDTLGSDNVVINLVEATTREDYYAAGYRAANGEAGNFDFFYGSGWGPDYGDPSTYLDTLLTDGGYMLKVLGLF
jgi:ABC-type oligopeptide transport system substrate-binding subunit